MREQTFLPKYKDIPGIQPSSLGKTFAFCSYCKADFTISHSGVYDIQRHCSKKHHKLFEAKAKADATACKITQFMPSKTVNSEEEAVIRAEAMFTELIVRMNVPLTTADIISRTVKSAFPDSKIAQQYSSGRSKTTAIVHCMASDIKTQLREKISSGPFCVATDGSNEQRDRQYPMVITSVGERGIETSLLSVPVLDLQSPSTGENIFNLIQKELTVPTGDGEPSVPWSNCLAFGCDNAAVMTGHKKGVYGRMKEVQPNIHLAGCPCHLIHRAAQKGASELPFSIDEILIDLYYYLDKSTKRLAELEKYQDDVKHQKILKHVSTRWLSVGKCLGRLLENWVALRRYFREEASSVSTSSAQSRQERLKCFFQSPTNRLYCLFLQHALQPFDILNQQLQSAAPQIHILQRSLRKLMRELLVRFVKASALFGKNVLGVDFESAVFQKADGQIMLSVEVRDMLQRKDEFHLRDKKIAEFHVTAKKFYLAACQYIKDKLPLDNELLKHAEVTDTTLRLDGANDSDLLYFLTRFPCLQPAGCSKDTIIEEFNNYRSHDAIPQLQKETIDETWVAIGKVKDAAGVPLFCNVSKVMLGILTIPHSNS